MHMRMTKWVAIVVILVIIACLLLLSLSNVANSGLASASFGGLLNCCGKCSTGHYCSATF